MDRRTVLAITICFMIYLGWQKFYLEPRLPQQQTTTQQQSTGSAFAPTGELSQAPTSSEAPSAVKSAHKHSSQTFSLVTGTGDAVVGDTSEFFDNWRLKKYHQGLSADTPAIDLNSTAHHAGEMDLSFDDPAYAYLSDVQGTLTKTATGLLWTYDDANVKLTRTYTTTPQQDYVDMELTAEFKHKRPGYAFVSLNLPYVQGDPEERDRQLVYFTDNSIERVHPKDAKLKEVATPVKYIGVTSRYFLMSVINNGPLEPKGLIQPLAGQNNRASLVYPFSGNGITLPLKVYFGPKELDILRSVDPTLDHTVDFGWFTVFAYPILKFLKFLYSLPFVGNYGVAIILLTVLLKLVTYPLTYKSMKSMKDMAKIQPQLAKIKEKYKDDKESLNREMMALMKDHGYNPMAGCLPMIIQMPIFFALYRVLYSSIDLYHAPFAFYIHDLSAKDPYYAMPILLSAFMFLQQKVTPNTATDPAQQKMMQFMPLIFGAFMISLPAGLTLYMLVNSVASIIQQMILNKKFDTTRHAPALARAR